MMETICLHQAKTPLPASPHAARWRRAPPRSESACCSCCWALKDAKRSPVLSDAELTQRHARTCLRWLWASGPSARVAAEIRGFYPQTADTKQHGGVIVPVK